MIPGKGVKKCISDLSSKEIYQVLMYPKKVEVKSTEYWNEKYSHNNIDWKIFFAMNICNKYIPRNIVDDNWKLFHGVVSTENLLSNMKLSDGKCVLCKEKDNLVHLLEVNIKYKMADFSRFMLSFL